MPKKKRTALRSSGPKTGSRPKAPKPRIAKFLEDNPSQRFKELIADRYLGADKDVSLAELRSRALDGARAMAPAAETNLTPATPGGSNWVELGPTAIPNGQTYGGARVIVTGRVTEIVQHPTDPLTLYVAAARGGVWKTTDGGVTWTPKSDNEASLAIGALALAKSNPQVLYAGTGEGDIYFYRLNYPLTSVNASYDGVGILKSTDGGDTWTLQASSTFTGACFYKLAVHPTNPGLAFAASNLGLFRTTNGGGAWTQLTSGLPAIDTSVLAATDIIFDPTSPDTAYCAFWGDGVYQTTNATAATPGWTKLAGGFPATNLSRIALAISPTAPNNLYALVADASDTLRGFYVSDNSGSAWTAVSAPVVEVYGAYTLNVAVDISTPDVAYLSGVELYKAVRTAGVWAVTNIGSNIHADNHGFASHPTDHLTIYAGNDGGIYKSADGGAYWDDSINEGLRITQFEFIAQHASSDAMVLGGTQDNGSEMFRNHPAFYHSADGDGGAAGIDAADAKNVIHTYYSVSPQRSIQGGKLGSYSWITAGLVGGALFYPPFAYDDTNAQNLAFGTDRINLDSGQGTGGWPTKVALPGITGRVSAVHYPNSNLIYAGTSSGQVYRLVQSGGAWTAAAIHAAPLPTDRWIWDISTLPGDTNTIVLVMAGFGTPHVWRGALSGSSWTWADISGTAPDRVPDAPANSLCIDPANPTHFYVGTDIGVFRTTDAGAHWHQFSDGLPNTAVYDLRLSLPARLLRAATHGRGLWERQLDVGSLPDVNLYLRDHLMATARVLPTPSPVTAPYEDPLQHVSLGDNLWWWHCMDAKIDAPDPVTHTYQMAVGDVDYLTYESKLEHRNAQRGVLNRVYVQVHNRGIAVATSVTVKILYADASPGLPNLPSDFWTAFPGTGSTASWKPIGAAKVIPALSPTRPEILEWDWVPPMTAATHSCLLIVVDCPQDPIPPASKVFDIATLVTSGRRVGLKNLHLIDAPPAPFWFDLKVFATAQVRNTLQIGGLPPGWSLGVLVPDAVVQKLDFGPVRTAKLTQAQTKALQSFLGRKLTASELKSLFVVPISRDGLSVRNLPAIKGGIPVLFVCQPQRGAAPASFSVVQSAGGKVIGGNTFVLRRA